MCAIQTNHEIHTHVYAYRYKQKRTNDHKIMTKQYMYHIHIAELKKYVAIKGRRFVSSLH